MASQKPSSKSNTDNKKRPKTKLKLRIPSKNPYGKIIEDPQNWPPRDDLFSALRQGPTAIKQWQNDQIEELIVPHLNGQQINQIIKKLGFKPSQIFEKIHEKLLFEFLNNLLNSIQSPNLSDSENNKKKLLNILKHSLRFIRIHQFKQLNVEILSRIDIIPKSVLRILSDHKNQDLLCEFPINIKRQVWSHRLPLFDKEFDDILRRYLNSNCNDDGSSYFDHIYKFNDYNMYLELTKIKRANNDTLKEMVNDIGSSPVLFNRFSENIEKYYLKTLQNDPENVDEMKLICFSNFRIDISCSLFDHAHKLLLMENDKIWRLIQMLYYENKHKNKLNLNKNQIDLLYKSLANVQTSMFLYIPYIKSLLFTSYISLLEDIAHKQILPRDSKSLSLLTQILSVSVSPKLIHNIHTTKVDHRVLFQFNPLLTASIYLDSLHIFDDGVNVVEQYPLNQDLIKWSKESSLCCYILIYYILFLLNKKRIQRLIQFVEIALKNQFDSGYLLAMNGLTEIHLICDGMRGLIQDKEVKWTVNQKCKFVKFLICFISQTKDDLKLKEPILKVVRNIGLFKGDMDRFSKQLKEV